MEFDRALARALLRIATGLDLLLHGLVRLPMLGRFAAGMARDFAPTILPAALVHGFAHVLPFAEVLIGALLLLGLWQRETLTAAALLMMALIFGTSLQQRWDTVTQQMIYMFLYAALLATRSWDRWSLDARR